jgi:hypothetical protein
LQYPLLEIDGVFRRLIPSKYPTVDLYEKFGSPQMQSLAAELEKLTNPRLKAKSRITGGDMAADSGTPKLQNWNHAPFAYPQPEGSRFLPPPYPVMELASSERGALARAILRREQFLQRTDEPVCGIDMRMISNKIAAEFVDLRDLSADTSELSRRELGQRLYEDGANGIVFNIAEVPGEDFLAIFKLELITERGLQGAHFRFRWDGHGIGRIFDFANNQDIDRVEIIGGATEPAPSEVRPLLTS